MFLVEVLAEQLAVTFQQFGDHHVNRYHPVLLSPLVTGCEAYWLHENRETIDGNFLNE
jgi:hypothetical protein